MTNIYRKINKKFIDLNKCNTLVKNKMMSSNKKDSLF